MKVGPRNAMVISVVSLALRVDGELSCSFGSAGPVPGVVRAPARRGGVVSRSALPRAASPIDDVRGTAAYRRHRAARPDAARARSRCLA
jgi:CO/xanthine dehydrogenase FAD-binding subunit